MFIIAATIKQGKFMIQQKPSVIIIGGGISGLSTAIYAQMQGFDSTIIEMYQQPGGCCTAWQRRDYTFDWCISWLNGSGKGTEMSEIWQELGVLKNQHIQHFDVFNTVISPEGKKVKFYSDPNKLEHELLTIAPEDKLLIKTFCQYIRQFQKSTKYYPFLKAPGLMTLWDKSKMMLQLLPYMRLFMKTLSVTTEQFANKFKNPFLREAFNWIFYDRHDHFALLAYCFNLADAANKNAGVPHGGSLTLAKNLEKQLLSLGGKIHYNTKVEEIQVHNDIAKGVILDNNQEIAADYIVSACDGYSVLYKMLKGKYIPPVMEDLYHKMATATDDVVFPGCVAIFIGVNKDYSDKPAFASYLLTKKQSEHLTGNYHQGISVQVRNKLYPDCAPKGKSVLYIAYLSRESDWLTLDHQNTPDLDTSTSNNKVKRRRTVAYRLAKKQVGQYITNYLEQHYPDLSNHIEYIDIATPLTSRRYTGNQKGSIFAWNPFCDEIEALEKYNSRHGPTLPKLKNFYMAGQWSVTGGVTRAAATGRHAVQYICKDAKQPFKTKPLSAVQTADLISDEVA